MGKLITLVLLALSLGMTARAQLIGGGGGPCVLSGSQTSGYVLTATDGARGCSWQTVGGASVDANTIRNAVYCPDTSGSANTITCAPTTTFPSSYAAGQAVWVLVANSNSGAATINVKSLGAKAVTKNGATALASGNLIANHAYLMVYDGTQFQVLTYTPLAADIPTLNQNTTGTAGGLSAAYIDWNASSGGASIQNKPSIPTVTGGTCTNQAVTAINTSVVPTCTTITHSYVDNSIALTGTDINTSNQVTATHLASPLPAAQGGTAVANTASLTLGSSNQNWASLGTGIVKNTTTTGALSNAAAADVYGLWTGSCSSSTFLRGDGSCQTPSGSGNTTSTSLTTNTLPKANGANSIIDSSISDDGTTVSTSEPISSGGFTSAATAAGTLSLTNNATPGSVVANSWGWTAPATVTTSWYGEAPNASPSANQIALFPAPTSNVSQWTWTNFTLAGMSSTFSSPLSLSTNTVTCSTCVVASSPGAGIAHFAGLTQTVTSSAVSLTADVSGVLPVANGGSPPIADTTVAITGATLSANTCSSTSTVTMTGLTTSMVVLPGYSASTSGLTGWGSSGGMVFQIWPSSSNTATYWVCNQSSGSVTYSSITFNVGAR